jgi:hypothetical protein
VKVKDGVMFKDMIPYLGIWGNLASTPTLFYYKLYDVYDVLYMFSEIYKAITVI